MGKKPSYTIDEKRKYVSHKTSGSMMYKYATLKLVIVLIRVTDNTSPLNGRFQRHYEWFIHPAKKWWNEQKT